MVRAPRAEKVHALPHIFLCHLATVNPYGPQLFQPKPLPPDGGRGLYVLCSVPKVALMFYALSPRRPKTPKTVVLCPQDAVPKTRIS
jgi:hypothetical protein